MDRKGNSLDMFRDWAMSLHKPIEGSDSGKRYKIISITDPGGEDCLNELEVHETDLTYNEARNILGFRAYGAVFCGGDFFDWADDSATVQYQDEPFRISIRIESQINE